MLRCIGEEKATLIKALTGGVKRGLSGEGLAGGYKRMSPVFQKPSFSAVPGEILAITGYNGIGKTTLIRCLCGLIKEQQGKVVLDGEECKMSGNTQDEVAIRCELEQLGLLPFSDRHPMALSGKRILIVVTHDREFMLSACDRILEI